MNAKIEWLQNQTDKVIYLMRGLPSSGKSYRAKELANNKLDIICSADDYFGEGQAYLKNWRADKLGLAHAFCKKKAKILMQKQSPFVVIDNTNTRIYEILPYFEMSLQYEYKFSIVEPTSPWWVEQIAPYLLDKEGNRKHLEKMCEFLWKKNQETHCVPLENIKKMLFRYHVNVTVDDLARCA